MPVIVNFLSDNLIIPVYYYLLGYLVIWALAAGIARINSNPAAIGSYDRATHQAWMIALILHLIAGLVFVTWLCMTAIEQERGVGVMVLYVLPYIAILMLDLYFLLTGRQPQPASAGGSRGKRGGRK